MGEYLILKEHILLSKTDNSFTSDGTAFIKANDCPCGSVCDHHWLLHYGSKKSQTAQVHSKTLLITAQQEAGSLLMDL